MLVAVEGKQVAKQQRGFGMEQTVNPTALATVKEKAADDKDVQVTQNQ